MQQDAVQGSQMGSTLGGFWSLCLLHPEVRACLLTSSDRAVLNQVELARLQEDFTSSEVLAFSGGGIMGLHERFLRDRQSLTVS